MYFTVESFTFLTFELSILLYDSVGWVNNKTFHFSIVIYSIIVIATSQNVSESRLLQPSSLKENNITYQNNYECDSVIITNSPA